MTNYRKLLIERANTVHVPFEPDKPLNHIQQANQKNLRAWRERYFLNKTQQTWMPK